MLTLFFIFSSDYNVSISVPSQGNLAVSKGMLSLDAQNRMVDLPVVLQAGQLFSDQVTVPAFRPTENVKLRWVSQGEPPVPLLINNLRVESPRGARTFCGQIVPQPMEHNVWYDFSTTTCVQKQ